MYWNKLWKHTTWCCDRSSYRRPARAVFLLRARQFNGWFVLDFFPSNKTILTLCAGFQGTSLSDTFTWSGSPAKAKSFHGNLFFSCIHHSSDRWAEIIETRWLQPGSYHRARILETCQLVQLLYIFVTPNCKTLQNFTMTSFAVQHRAPYWYRALSSMTDNVVGFKVRLILHDVTVY